MKGLGNRCDKGVVVVVNNLLRSLRSPRSIVGVIFLYMGERGGGGYAGKTVNGDGERKGHGVVDL